VSRQRSREGLRQRSRQRSREGLRQGSRQRRRLYFAVVGTAPFSSNISGPMDRGILGAKIGMQCQLAAAYVR